jgi:hypothetical protein
VSHTDFEMKIVLTKNPASGVLSIDTIERGKHNLRPIKSTQAVEGIDNRFTITFGDGSVDTFESPNAMDIIESINEVIQS